MNDYVRKRLNQKISRVEAAVEVRRNPGTTDLSKAYSGGWNSAMASIKEALEKDER